MKRYRFLISLGIVFSCQLSEPTFPWSQESYSEVLAEADDKIVMLEFYTDW